MKLSVSIPDELWWLLKAKHPDMPNSALVQLGLRVLLERDGEPSDAELIEIGRRAAKRFSL